MGSQQLFLIILGLLLVMAAIAVATNLFDSNAVEKNRDYLLSDCINISHFAQQYYRKPSVLGGGGSSYIGFNKLISSNLKQNANGKYELRESVSSLELIATGTVKGNDRINLVKVSMTVRPDTAWSVVLN